VSLRVQGTKPGALFSQLPVGLRLGYNAAFELHVKETGMRRGLLGTSLLLVLASLIACTPKVGSDAWCEVMSEKPKGDWTANQAADFAKHCLLKLQDEGKP